MIVFIDFLIQKYGRWLVILIIKFISLDVYKVVLLYDAINIPGPSTSRNNTSVYLQSLIAELKDFSVDGLGIYYASKMTSFVNMQLCYRL